MRFHEEVFEKGEASLEFEHQGRGLRLEGIRRGKHAFLRLLDVTRERQLLEENRLMGATLAHEFRTPLTALRGYVEALEDYLPPEDFPRRAWAALLEHTERLSRLVRDLLFLFSLERDLRLELQPVPVQPLVEKAAALVEPLLKEKALRLEIQGPLQSLVKGDPDYLMQALIKVLENAARFSPPGGIIHIDWEEGDEFGYLKVQDQGPGIPPEKREKVFEPFFREGGKGLGLGLALARRLVRAQGGELTAAPSSSGAFLVFKLPLSLSQRFHNRPAR